MPLEDGGLFLPPRRSSPGSPSFPAALDSRPGKDASARSALGSLPARVLTEKSKDQKTRDGDTHPPGPT